MLSGIMGGRFSPFITFERFLKKEGFLKYMKPMLVIERKKGWGTISIKELWSFRSLIGALISRDLKARYRKTILGPIWFIISPFMTMVFSSLVFGGLAKLDSEGFPYPIFFYSAMLPWDLFRISVNKVNNSLLEYMPWLTKIYMPPLIAPISSAVTGFIDWAMSLVVLIGLLLFYQIQIRVEILFLPVYLLMVVLTASAIGLMGAALAVRFRDIQKFVSFLISAWYYVTPVIYSVNLIPENLLWLYKLNPMYWVIEGFRWSLLGTGTPPQPEMIYPIAFFVVLFVFSLFVFERTSRGIVDVR